MIGLSFIHQPKKNLRLKWMLSRFSNDEKEAIDITGAYLFGEREFDKAKPDFGLINNPAWGRSLSNFCTKYFKNKCLERVT